MEVCDAFVLSLNEIMVPTTRFLPLLNAFRCRLSKDLRYLSSRSLLALAAILLAAMVIFKLAVCLWTSEASKNQDYSFFLLTASKLFSIRIIFGTFDDFFLTNFLTNFLIMDVPGFRQGQLQISVVVL